MMREFTAEERAAFTPGAQVLVGSKDHGWEWRVVAGPIRTDWPGERVPVNYIGSVLAQFKTSVRPGNVRMPDAVEGLDYVWVRGADGERVPSVLFCRECDSADVRVAVRRLRLLLKSSALSEAERCVYFTEPVTDIAHLDDYALSCMHCTQAVDGWPTNVDAREYARRLEAVRGMGYLPESQAWNAQRRNLAAYLVDKKERGGYTKAEVKEYARAYVANGWGTAL